MEALYFLFGQDYKGRANDGEHGFRWTIWTPRR